MVRGVWMQTVALVLLLAGWQPLRAEGPARSLSGTGSGRTMQLSYGGVLSHVAVGGPWRTILTVVNIHKEKPAHCELQFWSSAGEPMTVTLDDGAEARSGSVFPVSLPPLGSVRLLTKTDDGQVRTGWATLGKKDGQDCFTAFYGTFRAVVPGQPDYEALVLGERPVDRAVVPFDNRQGFGTALALVNPFQSIPLELDVEVYGEDGKLLQRYRERLEGGGHAAFQISEKWAETADRAGLIRIRRVSDWGFTALGLLFNPTKSVTTVPVASNR